MKKTQIKATGGVVKHRPKTISIKEPWQVEKHFDSKSIMVIKENDNYFLSINRKLARKLDLDLDRDETIQVMQFPEAKVLMIGKRMPFPKSHDYRFYVAESAIVNDLDLTADIVKNYNLDFTDCTALLFREIVYQPIGNSYMAILHLQ